MDRFGKRELGRRGRDTVKRLMIILTVVCGWAGALGAAVTAGYTGSLPAEDVALLRFFIKKAGLFGSHGRYDSIVLELKTAERILAGRDRALGRELARAYLEAAQGYLYYFKYPHKRKEAYLALAEICLKSAHGLDPATYGESYRFLLALKRQRAALYQEQKDLDRLAALQKQLRDMGEHQGEVIFRRKVIQHQQEEAKKAARRHQQTLDELEDRFRQALKAYQTAFIRESVTVYGPFLHVINTILQETPNPPGGSYHLHALMVKYNCRKEVSEILARRKR